MMTSIRSSRLVGPVSVGLAMIMTLVLMMPAGSLPTAEAAARRSRLLLFPVLDRTEAPVEDVAARATAYFQVALNEIDMFQVMEFSRTSPLVMRAVEEGRIRAVDLEIEVADPATAIELGHALDADKVGLIAIDGLDIDDDPMRVEALINGQIFDVDDNFDPETLEVVEDPRPTSTFGVAGRSRVREGYDSNEAPLIREALRDAAQRAASVLEGEPPVPVEERVEPRRDGAWKWIAGAVLLTGLIVALDSNGNDVEAPDPEAIAPRPLPLRQETAAIRLRWEPPVTDLDLLGYDLQRSTDHGRTWNPVPDSPGNVLPGHTEFADFNVEPGISYAYRIRAQYAARGPSAWVRFGAIEFRP